MNIRLFRIYSVPIRISSLELHVPGTCLFILWGGTWRLRATYVDYSYFCALVGVRIYTCPYMCTQLKIHDIKSLVFLVPEVSLAQFYFLFDGPGMSFVEGIVCPQASQTCCDSYTIGESIAPSQTTIKSSHRCFGYANQKMRLLKNSW